MEKNRTEFVKAAYRNLVALYGNENALYTFWCCSNEGAMLKNSTIDEIRLEGDYIVFYYNINTGDCDYFESFKIEDLETFFLCLSNYFQKQAKEVEVEEEMKVRITFRSEIYIEGKDLRGIKDIFEALDLGYDALKPYEYEFVELVSVEDADTYEDLMGEWKKC